LNEALPKSTHERLHRTVRPKKPISDRNLIPVVKRKSDTNPRQTSRGDANYKGDKHERLRKKLAKIARRKIADKITESVEYLRKAIELKDQDVVAGFWECKHPITVLRILDKLPSRWDNVRRSLKKMRIVSLGESKKIGPYAAMISDDAAVKVVKERAMRDASIVSKYFPVVWIESVSNDVSKLAMFNIIVSDTYSDAFCNALNEDRVVTFSRDSQAKIF